MWQSLVSLFGFGHSLTKCPGIPQLWRTCKLSPRPVRGSLCTGWGGGGTGCSASSRSSSSLLLRL
eukprot:9207875-Alexandrium_andersonii.AAC.1